jgi:hypothetical protein
MCHLQVAGTLRITLSRSKVRTKKHRTLICQSGFHACSMPLACCSARPILKAARLLQSVSVTTVAVALSPWVCSSDIQLHTVCCQVAAEAPAGCSRAQLTGAGLAHQGARDTAQPSPPKWQHSRAAYGVATPTLTCYSSCNM